MHNKHKTIIPIKINCIWSSFTAALISSRIAKEVLRLMIILDYDYGNIEDRQDYESMDQTTFLDEYFFKGDKFTDEGKQFLARINGFRTDVTNVLGENKQFANILVKRFSTNTVTNRDGKKIKWLE